MTFLPQNSSAIEWETSDIGQTATFPMAAAPFPHASRADGFVHQGKVFPADIHYSDNNVTLFLPGGFDGSEKVNLLFYYHGWANSIEQAIEEFRLREQVAASKRNVALVFPEGPKNANDSGLGKLEDENGLKNLATEVLETLKAEKKTATEAVLGDVVLSGHSGAYRGIAFGLHQGGLNDHITETWLLDASYGNQDYFLEWMLGGADRRFLSVFTEHLGGDNTLMMANLAKVGAPYLLRLDGEFTPEELQENRICFIYTTTKNHNEAVQLLGEFLDASTLPQVRGE